MNKYAVLLNDGTEIAVTEATIAPSFVVTTANKEAAMEIWDKLTVENLAEIQLKKDDAIVGRYFDVSVEGVQFVVNTDGSTTAHFYLHGAVTTTASGNEIEEKAMAYDILMGVSE